MIAIKPCFHEEYFFINYERTTNILQPPPNTFVTATIVDVPHCEYIEHFTFMETIFMIYTILNLSLFLGVVFTAYCVYHPMMKSIQNTIYEDELPKPTLYEERYNLKKSSSENTEPNPNSYVMETTPDGLVIMRYDMDNEGFVYWSDKSVAYKYLEVVGRKYAHMNCCKHLFIHEESEDEQEEEEQEYDSETEEQTQTTTTENNESEETQSNDDDDVFVKRKQPQTTAPTKTGKNIQVELNRSSKDIQKNKYIHRGKINEFQLTKDNRSKNKEKDTITFSSFKQMLFGSLNTQPKQE